MDEEFLIRSSDPELLKKAVRIAEEFARQYIRQEVVGIVFLGAIVRGYFDSSADIDIAIFKKRGSDIPLSDKFRKIEGLEVQVWLADYESEQSEPWDMAKRWTYSRRRIFHDPLGKVARLLEEKVPLKPEEKRWMMMSGLTLSEWYVNRLTRLWVERGNIVSAHHMIAQGLNYFFEMLFGLNDRLVPDMKWRFHCAERLEKLPPNFRRCVQDAMLLHSFSEEELGRRQSAFMEMWREIKPVVEKEVGMSFDEMMKLV